MFNRLFGRKSEKAASQAAVDAPSQAPMAPVKVAPGTKISYSPVLIEELRYDHKQLLKTFGEIGAAHAAGNMGLVSALLEKFRTCISAHLLKENVRLYIYLERALASDGGSHTLMRQYRQEMDGIGRAVMNFLERYRNVGTDPSLAGSFGADLAAVGKVLVERIQNEENTLYPLYLPDY